MTLETTLTLLCNLFTTDIFWIRQLYGGRCPWCPVHCGWFC